MKVVPSSMVSVSEINCVFDRSHTEGCGSGYRLGVSNHDMIRLTYMAE